MSSSRSQDGKSSLDPSPSLLAPPLPQQPDGRYQWGKLYGAAASLAIANAGSLFQGLVLAVTDDVRAAVRLEEELSFFTQGTEVPVMGFPDWETLPYDVFAPLPELVSQRLATLNRLPGMSRGLLVVPVSTLLQRLPPRSYLDAHSLILELGDQLQLDDTRRRFEEAGYQRVSQVISHGEFAVRGSLLDVFPMGSPTPFRVDLLDDEVDSIRTFDPETQRSLAKVDAIRLLPAREFPLSDAGIARFRQSFRTAFEGDPQQSIIYEQVSQGSAPAGIEYYLPLFFEKTETLFDYLPANCLLIYGSDVLDQAKIFLEQVEQRYSQRRFDRERPLLPPGRLYLSSDELAARMKSDRCVRLESREIESRSKGYACFYNFPTRTLPPLAFQARAARPAGALQDFLSSETKKVLFVTESAGRREMLLDRLRDFGIGPVALTGWDEFLSHDQTPALTIGPLEQGLWIEDAGLAVVTESQLYGERVRQERRRAPRARDPDQILRDLSELTQGAPVVHEDHGVGRYLGLQSLQVGGMETEFLTLEYSGGDKLYVPVSSLHLISRYTGTSPEKAPLHRLGGEQWERLKRRAAEKARDVAAELLEVYARRQASPGFAFPPQGDEYASFASAFEFEETPDQLSAIEQVLDDMQTPRPMDRVVCGDVGFGKTEVAMRAAFAAAQANRQVAVLVPTTLLAEQHQQNFADRFADWPIRVESLSRFRTGKKLQAIIDGLAAGTVDIVIGTHKLLQAGIRFQRLGLLIVDEEHRFGVRHKEKIKAMRSEVDMLTLTATPIPRTLNMAMSGLRDLSIIATPPAERHPIKTFINQWNDALIQEACQREIKRGGQIYFLHNEVSSIDNMSRTLGKLLPDARIRVAHGQMRERELEQIMRDFYHQRFNLLLCTTIIESGIDVPNANTIIINRADKLGLAQLHQLRGRVGRSHHRAYAYLITPPPKTLTEDARKRLEAIESLEDLGAGFTLATHDLEIRGAGELLGEEQSGQIQEIGFTLYNDLLERAVRSLKAGQQPELDRPLEHGAEIDLQIPALLPESYLPDVHSRLIFYKRIASAETHDELRELKVEMIDRFGLIPEAAQNLFGITALKLDIQPLGILKIEAHSTGGRLLFESEPKIDPARIIRLIQERPTEFKLDGSDKLRFFRDMENRQERLQQIRQVIEIVTGH